MIAVVGAMTLYFITAAQTMVQLDANHFAGECLGVYLLAFNGMGALGGPLVGYVDSSLGPRAGLLVAGIAMSLCTLGVAARIAHTAAMKVRLNPTASGCFVTVGIA